MSTYLAEYHERCFYVYFLLILQSQRNHLNKLVSHLAVSDERKKHYLFTLHSTINPNPQKYYCIDYIHASETKHYNSSQNIHSQDNCKLKLSAIKSVFFYKRQSQNQGLKGHKQNV